jgi:hypothetical protein
MSAPLARHREERLHRADSGRSRDTRLGPDEP